jgi:hypothetical protein
MRFDWYQATIEEKPLVALELIRKLGHGVRQADGFARLYHYTQGWDVHHNQHGVVARIMAGGNGQYPHALASSSATDAFVDLVRTEWPGRHLVTRMDSAQDFVEPGAYDRLRAVAKRVARRHRLSFAAYEDELHPMAGRTQYVGSPRSDYRARLYEKGWEQVAKLLQGLGPSLPADAAGNVPLIRNELTGEDVKPEDWTRLECQVRPRREEGKRAAAALSPVQAWGVSDWVKDLADEAMELDLERIDVRTRKVSKDEESRLWMCKAYAKILQRWHGECGDWACVGKEIGAVIEKKL